MNRREADGENDSEHGDVRSGGSSFDVFVSHWSGDLARVRPLVEALTRSGLTVWFDESAIEDHESITRAVREGVAQSKALLAYYSATYPTRRACQWELTAAFAAAQQMGNPIARVFAVNPERAEDGHALLDHIQPVELRDALTPTVPDDVASVAEWAGQAARIAELVGALTGPLGDAPSMPSRQIGRRLAGDPGFVGRLFDLWQIHSMLSASDAVQITGSVTDAAQLVGLGGVGKSLLAEEYALRFGAAYPGGIFWLNASEGDERGSMHDAAQNEATRNTRLRMIAARLGLPIENRSPDEIIGMIGAEIAAAGRCLWIVDDLSPHLDSERARQWMAPHPGARTLITTRARRYEFAPRVDLGRLSSAEGFELLTAARLPQAGEREVALAIIEDLGGHPLALGVASRMLAAEAGVGSYADYRSRLASPTEDELELAAELGVELPNGHEPSIASTLLRSVQALDEHARDLLQIASLLSAAPIPKWLFLKTIAVADALSHDRARRIVVAAVHAVDAVSLCDLVAAGEEVSVHALVSRTVRFRDVGSPRRATMIAAATEAVLAELAVIDSFVAPADVAELIVHARALAQTARAEQAIPQYTAVATQVALYDFLRGDYVAAEQVQREVLDEASDHWGRESADALASAAVLARTLYRNGQIQEARAIQEQGIATSRDVHGREHRKTIELEHDLTRTLSELGEWQAAAQLGERVVGGYGEVLGPEDPNTLMAMLDLAQTHIEMSSPDAARKLQEAVLETQLRLTGEEHPGTLRAMVELASTLMLVGKDARAAELLEKAVPSSQQVLGEEHQDTLAAQANLAMLANKRGEAAKARELGRKVLDARLRVLGEQHLDTLAAMEFYALIEWEQGDRDAARELEERVLDGRRRALGADHPDTLWAADTLARIACAQDATAPVTPRRRTAAKVGRNEPCPCGSGVKYKLCHGR
jgi:tetratricopeptide (TPR) repeat protein